MKHQIMTVMLDAFLIINALPPKYLQKRFPYFFHGAFAPLFTWSRRPCHCASLQVQLLITFPCLEREDVAWLMRQWTNSCFRDLCSEVEVMFPFLSTSQSVTD